MFPRSLVFHVVDYSNTTTPSACINFSPSNKAALCPRSQALTQPFLTFSTKSDDESLGTRLGQGVVTPIGVVLIRLRPGTPFVSTEIRL